MVSVKTIGNILWFFIAGLESALAWLAAALIFAITIVGIPFAVQCLKMAKFTIWPFGHTVVHSPTAVPFGWVGNVLWLIPGVLISLVYLVCGIALCITIIGIPFGLQAFKFISLALFPFGKEVISTNQLRRTAALGASVYGSY